MKQTVDIDTWFIAKNENNSVIHYGYCPANTELDSGQPIVEEYNNEADWLERLKELGITPE